MFDAIVQLIVYRSFSSSNFFLLLVKYIYEQTMFLFFLFLHFLQHVFLIYNIILYIDKSLTINEKHR